MIGFSIGIAAILIYVGIWLVGLEIKKALEGIGDEIHELCIQLEKTAHEGLDHG